MLAGIARAATVAALAVPVVLLAAPSASAEQPVTSNVDQPLRTNVDAPYIWVNICVHIPTPGSATLDWCWP
ncbi:hypothetical protein [Nocardia jejuensis]|uniref:hypothetical protein n=1 Tax=Nocardia jejuensis TaxID=328049 RepID=UPI0008295D94|nr:hypothetical protein [Nocardia jejuensis]